MSEQYVPAERTSVNFIDAVKVGTDQKGGLTRTFRESQPCKDNADIWKHA
jgi:hypothetical protein